MIRRAVSTALAKINRSVVFTTVMALIPLALFGLVSFGTFSLMDGWSYFPLGSLELPYRDYYYPVPPLTYWEAQIASHFPNPLVALRLLLLPLVPLYFYSLRYIALQFARPWIATLSAMVMTTSLAALRLEPLAGWNTQTWIFLTAAIALYVAAMKARRRFRFVMATLSGFAFVLACLAKQTSLVPTLLVLVVSPMCINLLMREAKAFRVTLVVFVTLLISGVALTFKMLMAGNFMNFLAVMMNSGGKSAGLPKSLNDLITIASSQIVLSPFWLVLAWFVISPNLSKASATLRRAGGVQDALIVIGLGVTSMYLFAGNLLPAGAGYFVILAIVVVAYIHRYGNHFDGFEKNRVKWMLGLSLGVPIFLQLAIWHGDLLALFASMWPVNNLLLFLGMTSLAGCVAATTAILFRSKSIISMFNDASRQSQRRFLVLIPIGLLSVGNLVNVLSSGGDPHLSWVASLVAVGIAAALEWLLNGSNLNLQFLFASIVTVVAGLFFLCVTLVSPYSWWGWSEPALTRAPRIDPNTNYISGVRLDAKVSDFYVRVHSSAAKAAAISRAPNPRIFTFPNIPATAAASEVSPYVGLQCWVQWYDVCPLDTSMSDLKIFMRDPASVIIWRDLVPHETEVHETLFTQGRSPLRDWQAFKEQEIARGRWLVIDRIQSSELTPLSPPIEVIARLPPYAWSEWSLKDWLRVNGRLPKN